ncbi:MAG: glycogen/starch/alpha-glucan family phosphorylase [Oscillospiraceae bacterium]|jgi:starch phosphorylase|nr:glycogen/starch/alpha-glucan family phosphorylase [Oscillospiraceae bacterium]
MDGDDMCAATVTRQAFMDSFLPRLKAEGYAQPSEAPPRAVHRAIGGTVLALIAGQWERERAGANGKQVCYISIEYLLGRLAHNNLFCLGILDDAKAWLAESGADFSGVEDIEDAALGNGGLGRLAACFLDSAAALALPFTGYGMRYRYGLFRQSFEDGFQREAPDDWHADSDPWSIRREDESQLIEFADQRVMAVPYDMPVIGYEGRSIRTLRLWQAEPVDPVEPIVPIDNDSRGAPRVQSGSRRRDAAEDLTRSLYPDDSTAQGKRLRLRQEYFMSAATVADILERCRREGRDPRGLPDMFAIQLNDTHPALAIPEMIRRLMNGYGFPFEDAFNTARRAFHYTNHTIMPEAMETWNDRTLARLLPDISKVIKLIQNHLVKTLALNAAPADKVKRMSVDINGTVRMAPLSVFASAHTNGVAMIHTRILRGSTLKDWHDVWPDRFLNETNGITFRRWLGLCNPELTKLINQLARGDALKDPMLLERMAAFADDGGVLDEFAAIKRRNKARLAERIARREGILVDPSSLFDIQIKRLHEYKRQLMNALNILMAYYDWKDGLARDIRPATYIFGAKAAPGYFRAKAVIKLINEIARLIRSDRAARELFRVVFVQDYNVSWAERLVPAADLSEQISMAGTEASGTGNMKFMLNGTVTLGTLDGANVEIVEAAGVGNNYIFGASAEDIRAKLAAHDPKTLLASDARLKRVVDALDDGSLDDGGGGMFAELKKSLLEGASWHQPDHYYVLGDMNDYDKTRRAAFGAYGSRAFTRMGYMNMCHAGRFSSDLTLAGYAKQVWNLR